MLNSGKRGQVAIYIIIAVVIVGAIVVFFAFRENLFGERVPAEFLPIYNLYQACIEEDIENGLSILGSQGGRIDTGEFEVGSDYSPFTNKLNFLGSSVPYWYYISSNGAIKEQAPAKSDMERELESYLEENVNNCNFQQYYEQGFYIQLPEEVDANVKIEDERVVVNLNSNLVTLREDRSARKSRHKIEVESKLGKLYDISRDIYNKEISEAFLEEYAIDTLRLYAPVDGVNIQCNPEIWQTREVVEQLKSGLEENIASIKIGGGYYRSDDRYDDYFVVDMLNDEPVSLVYLSGWPSKVEITPAGQELMIAEPVGNQQGLGILGFCYVPYHFIYDLSFPVLVRVGDGLESFQFPVVVIVDNNQPRKADLISIAEEAETEDLCSLNVGEARIYTFDSNLNAVEADVSYRCLNSVCNLGKTEIQGADSFIDAKVPVCFNGQVIARAEGYSEERVIFSSNSEVRADVILQREYEVEIELEIDGVSSNSNFAVLSFKDEEGNSESAVFPDNRGIKLNEGNYEVEVYVYSNTSITIPGTNKVQCVDVARRGIAGLFGATKEECFNINVPAIVVDQALIGGGKAESYILESELQKGRMRINVDRLPLPRNMEQLQYNFEAFDSLKAEVEFV